MKEAKTKLGSKKKSFSVVYCNKNKLAQKAVAMLIQLSAKNRMGTGNREQLKDWEAENREDRKTKAMRSTIIL